MSEFDKEAERRRLREKYEAEREDRETTERMSELLLQGATMTNQHCDTCGNPIFRYQGQEFCPTCQAAAESADTQQSEGGQATESTQAEAAGTQPRQAAQQSEPTHSADQAPVPRQQLTPDLPEGATDLTAAAESLTAAITTLATRAQQTDDPRRAAEFLEAAHEAAEALATLTR